jgi:hypothetical protein
MASDCHFDMFKLCKNVKLGSFFFLYPTRPAIHDKSTEVLSSRRLSLHIFNISKNFNISL